MKNTRQAARMEIRQDGETPDLGLMWNIFRWRALREFNQIPAELRKTRLSSIESQPKKVVVVVFIDGLVLVVDVVLPVVVVII